ncbi:hypothetical protein [Actinoplanes solisilvae]|uniref:hypothetical protein n=1 Tax=Actinoplanes solisilvae TaxID=2486853 RepID=UPI000FD72DF0|nr:hypothetical protein [Actinoplanes solisilvae]
MAVVGITASPRLPWPGDHLRRWSPADPTRLGGVTETLLAVIRHYRDHIPLLRAVMEMEGHDLPDHKVVAELEVI